MSCSAGPVLKKSNTKKEVGTEFFLFDYTQKENKRKRKQKKRWRMKEGGRGKGKEIDTCQVEVAAVCGAVSAMAAAE